MLKQQVKIKSSIVDIKNHLKKVLSSFDSLNKEFLPSFCLVDIFSDQFSFTTVNCKDTDIIRTHNRLNKVYENSLNNQDTILIIVNTSVKNNITTLVSHIQKSHNIVNKCVHHTMNVNYIEAELFAIRYRID